MGLFSKVEKSEVEDFDANDARKLVSKFVSTEIKEILTVIKGLSQKGQTKVEIKVTLAPETITSLEMRKFQISKPLTPQATHKYEIKWENNNLK